jgi:hypothetical protein
MANSARKFPTVAYLWHAGNAKEETPYYEALLEGFSRLGYVDAATFGWCIDFRTKYRNVSGAWPPSSYP